MGNYQPDSILNGRTGSIATRVLWIEIEGAALCERGHRHLDSVNGARGEHLIVRLDCGRNWPRIQNCKFVCHLSPPSENVSAFNQAARVRVKN